MFSFSQFQQRTKDAGVPTKQKLNAKSLMEKVVADRIKPYLGEEAIVGKVKNSYNIV
jgi:hypothetical protein